MIPTPQPRFQPNRRWRRLRADLRRGVPAGDLHRSPGPGHAAGLDRGRGSEGPPDNPWYAIGPNLAELFALVRRLASQISVDQPAERRVPGRDRGQSLAAGSGRRDRHPGRRGCGRLPRGVRSARPVRWIIQTNIANLAGVPSIVYGILGLAVFVRAFGIKGLALGPTLLAGVLTLSLLDPADHRDHDPGSPAGSAAVASPGRAGTGRDPLAGGPRSRAALGAARHHDRHDPRAVARNRRDGTPAHGRARPARSCGIPKGPLDRYSALPVEIYNYAKEPDRRFQTVAAGGILILVAILLLMNATAIVIRNRFRRYH